jgi:hypothetical protein
VAATRLAGPLLGELPLGEPILDGPRAGEHRTRSPAAPTRNPAGPARSPAGPIDQAIPENQAARKGPACHTGPAGHKGQAGRKGADTGQARTDQVMPARAAGAAPTVLARAVLARTQQARAGDAGPRSRHRRSDAYRSPDFQPVQSLGAGTTRGRLACLYMLVRAYSPPAGSGGQIAQRGWPDHVAGPAAGAADLALWNARHPGVDFDRNIVNVRHHARGRASRRGCARMRPAGERATVQPTVWNGRG